VSGAASKIIENIFRAVLNDHILTVLFATLSFACT